MRAESELSALDHRTQPYPCPSWGRSHRVNGIKCWAKRKARAKESHEWRSGFREVRKSAFGAGHRPRASVYHLKPHIGGSPASIFFLRKWFPFLKFTVIQYFSDTQSTPPGVVRTPHPRKPLVIDCAYLCRTRVLLREPASSVTLGRPCKFTESVLPHPLGAGGSISIS